MNNWKRHLLFTASQVFENGAGLPASLEQQTQIDALYWQIGQLKVERDFLASLADRPTEGGTGFFSQSIGTIGAADRKALIDPNQADLSLVQQCELLGLARSSDDYQPVAPSAEELILLRLIDQIYLETPIYGSRRMTVALRQQGYLINRKRVQRLMAQLGVQAIYPKPKLSQRHPDHQVYPY